MRLLVAVVPDPEKLDDVLSRFLDLGITGATVLNGEGMGSVLSQEIPIFAGLSALTSGSRPQNRLILSVIPEGKVGAVIDVLQEVSGGLDSPNTGIAFTLPVEGVFGLAPPLPREDVPGSAK